MAGKQKIKRALEKALAALQDAEEELSSSEGDDEVDSALEDIKARKSQIEAQLDEEDSEVPFPELTDKQLEKLKAAIKKLADAVAASAATEKVLKATAALVKVLKTVK